MDLLAPETGRLLVATTDLVDPNFAQSVVLLLDHDEDGTLGVILNRPTEASVRTSACDCCASIALAVMATSATIKRAEMIAVPADRLAGEESRLDIIRIPASRRAA